jgi:hypothetical protein
MERMKKYLMFKCRLYSLIFLVTGLISLVSLSPVAALAQESGIGNISGQIVNGTEGGGSVAGIEVSLITYVNGVAGEARTTIADSKGKFQFEDVTTDNEYLVSTEYMDVNYYYSVAFEAGETTVYVEVGVCDSTDSDEAVRVEQAHTIINAEENDLLVTEVFVLLNDGDKTYVGTNGVLVFTLPQGAIDFQAPQEQAPDYEFLDNNRVTYLVPFPPGERQIIYAYTLPVLSHDGLTIPLQVDYPTDVLDIMVAGEDIEVAVTQLTPADPIVTGTGERFIHFHGENILRNTVINLSLSHLSDGGSPFFVILWVIIAVVIIGIAVYLLKRWRRGKTNE